VRFDHARHRCASAAVDCGRVLISNNRFRRYAFDDVHDDTGVDHTLEEESQGDLTFEPRERSTEAAMDAAVSKQPETQSEMPPDARGDLSQPRLQQLLWW